MAEREIDTHVYFWGTEFSNWYECRYPHIRYKGITFFNTEQAFIWEKAVFFGDMQMAEKIVKTPDPKLCKELGRKVRGFDTERWMIASYPIMVAVNYAKYSQNIHLRKILLDTGDKILVEASPYDKIWG